MRDEIALKRDVIADKPEERARKRSGCVLKPDATAMIRDGLARSRKAIAGKCDSSAAKR